MSGTGSLSKINRTLYVGRLHEEHGVSAPRLDQSAWRDGGKTLKGGRSASTTSSSSPVHDHDRIPKPIDHNTTRCVPRRTTHTSAWFDDTLASGARSTSLRVLSGRSCAFVTYKYEANAQFAKEACSISRSTTTRSSM